MTPAAADEPPPLTLMPEQRASKRIGGAALYFAVTSFSLKAGKPLFSAMR
jgi:hypothetical protein